MQDPGGLGSREKILKTKEEEQQQTEYCFSFPCWSSSCSSPALLTTTIVDSSSVFINRVLDNGCVLLLQPKITLLSSSESTQQSSSSRPIALALELLPLVIYLLVVKTCLQNVLKTNLTFLKEGFFQKKQDFFQGLSVITHIQYITMNVSELPRFLFCT